MSDEVVFFILRSIWWFAGFRIQQTMRVSGVSFTSVILVSIVAIALEVSLIHDLYPEDSIVWMAPLGGWAIDFFVTIGGILVRRRKEEKDNPDKGR